MRWTINIQSKYLSLQTVPRQIVVQNKIWGDKTSRIDPFLKVNVLRLPSRHLNTNRMPRFLFRFWRYSRGRCLFRLVLFTESNVCLLHSLKNQDANTISLLKLIGVSKFKNLVSKSDSCFIIREIKTIEHMKFELRRNYFVPATKKVSFILPWLVTNH